MNIAVIFRSITGHSKKIAKAIAEQLGVEALDVKENPKLKNIDLLFVVGGVYSSKNLPELTKYAKTLNPNMAKQAILITSSATKKAGQDEIRKILTENKIKVAKEEYHCFGNFLFIKMGHPNQDEIGNAVEFAKKAAKAK